MFFLRRGDKRCKLLCTAKHAAKKICRLAFARRANQRFHMIQVTLQRPSPSGRQPVFGFWQAAVERLGAGHVPGMPKARCSPPNPHPRAMFCRLSGSRNVTRPSKAKRLPRMPTMRVVGALVSTLQSRVTAQTARRQVACGLGPEERVKNQENRLTLGAGIFRYR